MREASLVLLFANRLRDASIEYMITGSTASIVYGEPRLTNDVDIVMHVKSSEDLSRIADVFPLEDFYVPPLEVEYVIVRKLEFHREGRSQKHLDDIAGMLRVSSDDIDFRTLEEMIAQRGLQESWSAALARKAEAGD